MSAAESADLESSSPEIPESLDMRPWFIASRDIKGVINWSEFWGNDQPVEIDVGCGRGLFLFNASQEHPERNYVGIELDFKEGRRGAMRLLKRNTPNARVIGGDATILLGKQIKPHSVRAVHVYFPDPWWKRRHHKRRIFTDEFVNWCANIIEFGGELHHWTDVKEYFEVSSALMNHHALFDPLPTPEEREPTHNMDYQTSFERKKRRIGSTIHRGVWRRKDGSAAS